MKLHKISAADRGFTLIEILIVLGILGIIFFVGWPIGLDFYLDYQLDSETDLLTAILEQARNLSMVNHNESDHGLYVNDKNFIVFQGSTFTSRVSSEDKIFPRVQAINVTGPAELVFAALSGTTASTTYNLSDGRKNRNVYVNAEGLIY